MTVENNSGKAHTVDPGRHAMPSSFFSRRMWGWNPSSEPSCLIVRNAHQYLRFLPNPGSRTVRLATLEALSIEHLQ